MKQVPDIGGKGDEKRIFRTNKRDNMLMSAFILYTVVFECYQMTEEATEMLALSRNVADELAGTVHTSLLKLSQKPLGIGIVGGSITGIANSLILGIPLIPSIFVGMILGFAVCLVFCPGMKDELALRRKLVAARSHKLSKRARIVTAFTSFD